MKPSSSLKIESDVKIEEKKDREGLENTVRKVRIDAQKDTKAFLKESVVVEGGE
ncbi:MAG: hypothetical protein HRU09_16380 [Oligoflexales bacterium]|nr:hypothetical protein [Oligoflexales bacterium]